MLFEPKLGSKNSCNSVLNDVSRELCSSCPQLCQMDAQTWFGFGNDDWFSNGHISVHNDSNSTSHINSMISGLLKVETVDVFHRLCMRGNASRKSGWIDTGLNATHDSRAFEPRI